jgi:hypothetical protein
MTIDEVMKLTDEELSLKVAEIQGHKNLEWMAKPFDESGKMLVDQDTHKAILSPLDNIVAAWDLWREMNYGEPYQWVIFGDGDGEISIEYFDWDYKGDRKQGSGLWAIDGPDTITITRAYILSRTRAT